MFEKYQSENNCIRLKGFYKNAIIIKIDRTQRMSELSFRFTHPILEASQNTIVR